MYILAWEVTGQCQLSDAKPSDKAHKCHFNQRRQQETESSSRNSFALPVQRPSDLYLMAAQHSTTRTSTSAHIHKCMLVGWLAVVDEPPPGGA